VSVTVLLKLDADVARARELVMGVARINKHVLPSPAPEVLFVRRGIDQLEFELRVWTDALDAWMEVKSDMTAEINEALRHNEIVGAAPDAGATPPAPVVASDVPPSAPPVPVPPGPTPGPAPAPGQSPLAAGEKARP
jgi:hypothetical protein